MTYAATNGLYYKSFTIIIYDRNDSTIVVSVQSYDQYYKAASYDHKHAQP